MAAQRRPSRCQCPSPLRALRASPPAGVNTTAEIKKIDMLGNVTIARLDVPDTEESDLDFPSVDQNGDLYIAAQPSDFIRQPRDVTFCRFDPRVSHVVAEIMTDHGLPIGAFLRLDESRPVVVDIGAGRAEPVGSVLVLAVVSADAAGQARAIDAVEELSRKAGAQEFFLGPGFRVGIFRNCVGIAIRVHQAAEHGGIED